MNILVSQVLWDLVLHYICMYVCVCMDQKWGTNARTKFVILRVESSVLGASSIFGRANCCWYYRSSPMKNTPMICPKRIGINIKWLHDIEFISHMIPYDHDPIVFSISILIFHGFSHIFPHRIRLRNTGWPRQRHDPPCRPPAVGLPRTAWHLGDFWRLKGCWKPKKKRKIIGIHRYPLVMTNIAMENHHF